MIKAQHEDIRQTPIPKYIYTIPMPHDPLEFFRRAKVKILSSGYDGHIDVVTEFWGKGPGFNAPAIEKDNGYFYNFDACESNQFPDKLEMVISNLSQLEGIDVEAEVVRTETQELADLMASCYTTPPDLILPDGFDTFFKGF